MKLKYSILIFALVLSYFSIGQTLIAHYSMNKTNEDVTGNHEQLIRPMCTSVYDALHTKGVYQKDFISTPSLYKLDVEKFSISVQFKGDKTGKMPVLVLGRACRMLGAYLTEDGKFALYGNNGASFSPSTISYLPNKWYQLDITYDKNTETATLYVDSKKAISAVISFESSCLTQWKYSNLDISTCDYSNGKMFVGTWKQLKVHNGIVVSDAHRDPYENVTTSIKTSINKTNIRINNETFNIEQNFIKDE